MPVPLPSLIIALASASLGALFVSADAALSGLSSARMAALLEQDGRPFKPALERYQSAPWKLRSTYITGRSICAAVTVVMMANVAAEVLPGILGTGLAILAAITLHSLADLTTSMARHSAEEWGLRLATYLRPFELLLLPLALPLEKLSSAISNSVQPEKPADPDLATAEVEHFVDEVERSGVVGAEPAEMIRNVLEFEDRRAREVMVPRTRVEAINASTPLAEVRRFVGECGHSRYPVYEGQLDNVIGILVAKDVFKLEGSDDPDASPESKPRTLVDVVRRDVVFVHEQQKLATLLREMRQKRQHLAVVVDEFGGTSGIVTMEDVIEEIVGDIRDEHDEESAPIQELGEGRLLANGAMHVEDLAAYLGLSIEEDDRATPLASAFEPSVEEGATITRWGLDLIAREVKSGQVERIEVRRPLHSLPPPSVVSDDEAVDISAAPESRRTSDTAPKPSAANREEDDDAPSRESGRREASNS